MTDRPIIFSGPMVRALLDGRKTQTRRLATSPLRRCEVGDRLWVRENFYQFGGPIEYAADGGSPSFKRRMTPSIHMPRWASRMTLIVEAVRVEPLQVISIGDALAEGVVVPPESGSAIVDSYAPVTAYRDLWNSLHGADSWNSCPDVVALTFRVEPGNIDRIAA